ncbi:MAG: MerR family transcriptional regulator [Myxococcota bacterium]|nr:MerR family transcriptional regulator [Myxococcota bacterium]
MAKALTLMRIGELAKRTGKTSRALHLYEELGLLTPVSRSDAGYRLYGDVNVARIQYIERLQQAGLSLKAIQRLTDLWASNGSSTAAMGGLRMEYERQLEEVQERISTLQSVQADLVASLTFLDGCRSCQHGDNHPNAACGACERLAGDVRAQPTLITGLMAH